MQNFVKINQFCLQNRKFFCTFAAFFIKIDTHGEKTGRKTRAGDRV